MPKPQVVIPPAAEIIAMLRPDHPRLLLHAEDVDRLKRDVQTDATLKQWFAEIRREADELLEAEPSGYEIPDGLRLLATSRRVLRRVQTLALTHLLTGEQPYLDRCWAELSEAAAFKDWNPRHFLDAAEMTYAFALGYDWLYHRWTDQQRTTLREAIVTHGLTPGMASYSGEASYGRWVKAHHNWNQVCNGGMIAGALAIADVEPELAGKTVHAALESLPLAMAEFAPDGAWAEGVTYWNYAMRYNAPLLAMLQSALGTDFGFAKAHEGFDRTGLFPVHMTTPLDWTFNFADTGSGRGPVRAPHMFWLYRTFGNARFAAYQVAHARPAPLDLVWYTPLDPDDAADEPLDMHFRGVEVACMRSAWDDPRAWYVGLKGGDNAANHSHLDLGSVVVDGLGQRWACDLGSENYNLPGYWEREARDGRRWTFYRLRAEAHNTVVVNPGRQGDQPPDAKAPITRFESSPERCIAACDLTQACAPHAEHAERTVTLHRGPSPEQSRVVIEDVVKLKAPGDLWWFWLTPAEVTIGDDGRSATLSQGGEQVRLAIDAPADARFGVTAAAPLPTSPNPDGQKSNDGVSRLAIHLQGVTETRIAVTLSGK